MEYVGPSAILCARSSVVSISSSCGATLLTMPSRYASSALTLSPVYCRINVLLMPIMRGNCQHEPSAGMRPRLMNVSEKRAFSDATRMSHDSAMPMPSPIA